MKKYLTKKYIWIGAISLVVIIVLVVSLIGLRNGAKETHTISTGEINQKVVISGKTKALESVNLGFDKGGKVAKTNAIVGDAVVPGQVLVELDMSELNASLLQASANLDAENAKLSEIRRGSREEEVAVSNANLIASKTSLDDAESNLIKNLNEAYSESSDIIRSEIDTMFNNGQSGMPQFKPSTNSSFETTQIESKRKIIENSLLDWNLLRSSFETSKDLGKFAKDAKDRMNYIRTFLDDVFKSLSNQTVSDATSRATASSARSSYETTLSNFLNAEEKYNNAVTALAKAQADYNLVKNGSSKETIANQEAKVLQMQAQVANVQAQIENAKLVSPIAGVITLMDIKKGEIASVGKTVVSVISNSSFEIEANVSEVNITKIAVGNEVRITFDAFPGKEFTGTVSYIDPAETLVDNVVSYKTKVLFSAGETKIKNGMTANLQILALKKGDVLRIPIYFSEKLLGKTYAYVLKGGNEIKTEVILGTTGDDGYAEVVSGLSEGEVVVMPIK